MDVRRRQVIAAMAAAPALAATTAAVAAEEKMVGRPLTPLSYAGAARRHRRRTVRRIDRRN